MFIRIVSTEIGIDALYIEWVIHEELFMPSGVLLLHSYRFAGMLINIAQKFSGNIGRLPLTADYCRQVATK
jgi:hypothetical protein